jgi:pilus assembly protein CpaE
MSVHIAVIGTDAADVSRLSAILRASDSSLEVNAASEAEASSVIASSSPVVVLGPLLRVEDAFALASKVAPSETGREVVMVTPDPSPEVLRAAMRLGVRDVLSAEDPHAEVASAILLALDAASRRAGNEAAATAPSSEMPRRRPTKVMTVFGTKGGVGKSVIATNIAVALANEGRSVALVDLDLQAGDAALMLQLVPQRTIFDAVQSSDRLDAEMLRGFMIEHECGLQTLAAPVRPEEAEAVTGSRVEKIIRLLGEIVDFVIIDTPASFNEVVLTAVENSDEVYSIATMDVPSLKSVKVSHQKLQQLGMDMGRVRLVLNRADSRVGLEAADVQSAAGCPIAAKIPSDRLVPRSVNRGNPVVLDAPRSPVAKSLSALAHLAATVSEEVGADVA